MTTVASFSDKWMSGMMVISLTLHLTVVLIAGRVNMFQQVTTLPAPVYVDLVTTPVAAPQQAPSAVSENKQEATARHVVMTPPVKASPTAISPPRKEIPTVKPSEKPATVDEESEKDYAERIKELELTRHHNDMLESIRRQVDSKKRETVPPGGMPEGTGSHKGSDYSSFIQSRLRDAFQLTIGSQGGTPMVVVRIIITAHGGLKSSTIEKFSGDKLFDSAVMQAVQLARKSFTPPPDGKEFNHVFVFKPDGINKR